LPGVTFGGVFSERKNTAVLAPSGFIVADIDHCDVTDIIAKISGDENIWFWFCSPGGDGLKVGLRAEGIETDKDHKVFFKAVELYFKEVYGIKIDPACKDISRLTFLSHDPGAFINPKPTFFNISEWTEKENPCQIAMPPVNGDGKKKYAQAVLQTACEKIRNSTPGNMHLTRLTMSRLVGGYCHYGINTEAIQALEQAVSSSATTNFENAMKTVRDGLENGKAYPITIPDRQNIRTTEITTPVPSNEIIKAAFAGQLGAAELFYRLFKDKFCFDHGAKLWFEFTGHYWKVESIGRVQRELTQVQALFDQALAEISSQIILAGNDRAQTISETEIKRIDSTIKSLQADRKACRQAKINLNNLSYRRQVAEFSALGEDSLAITGDEWDVFPWLLPVKNGIVDLKTGTIRNGKPGDFLKSVCTTVYDPTAECPNFKKFLFEVLGDDPDTFIFMQKLLGASLIGQSTYKQYLPIFSGQGRNGKDTLMGVLCHVLGPQLTAPVQSELLLDTRARSSQGPSPDKMKLRGLRIAYCNETSQGKRFNTGTVKVLSGGGQISARPLHGAEVTWEQTQILILMTNNRPSAPVDDYAFWKRIKAVHFPLSFVEDPTGPNERKADPKLSEKIKKEAPGVLNWLIEGCLEYQREGCTLIEPDAVKKACADYLKDVDLIGMFIEDCCLVAKGLYVPTKDIYAKYRDWVLTGGSNNKPVTTTAFSLYLKKRFDSGKTTKGNRCFFGIGLLE